MPAAAITARDRKKLRARNFLLDIVLFSSIIYSLYEPGSLSPELVIVRRR